MRRVVRPLEGILLILLFLLSCAPKRSEIFLDTERVSASTLIGLIEANERKVQTIVGRGIVSFESPRLAGSASFELSMKKPDSLLAVFEGPFGIDLGLLFLSRQKYVMYNSTENTAVTGIPSANIVRSVIPFDLAYDQILSVFSGFFSIPSNLENLRKYAIVDDQFFLSFERADSTCNYWIDPAYLRVSRYEVLDSRQQLLLEARSSAFIEQDEVNVPKRISITFPREDRNVSLYYSKIRVNDPSPSFDYSIPSNAHTVVR